MAEFGGNSQDSDNNLEPFNNHCEHVAAKLDDAGSSNHCEDKALADGQRSVEAMKCVEEIDNANDVAMDSSNEIADKSIGYDSVIDNTENLTLGTLKKDDSGICMEKSPQKEGTVSDESEATHTDTDANSSRTDTDSGKMKTDRSLESVSEENRTHTSLGSETDAGLVQDFLDTEENMSSNRYDLDLANHSSSDSEKPDSDTDVRRTRKRRQSRSRSRSNSDSRSRSRSRSSSSEREADDEDVKSKSSDSPDEMEIDLEPPRHKWTALYEMRNREYGSSSTLVGHTLFRQRVTSALCMVQRMELQYKMDYHEGCVNALNFNRKGTLLASGSDDLNIVLWNWANNKPALVYDSGHRSNVFQSKFLPYSGDLHVVSCARDGQVRLAELSTTGICKDTKKLAQHRGAAHKLALEMDSAHLFLSCGEDAVTHEIDLRQEKANKISTTKEGDRKVALYSIHSNPSNSFEFCVGGRDHFIRIYDKRKIAEDENDGVLKKFCPPHLLNSDIKADVTCAVYNYNGTEVMGTYNDEDIYLFDNQHSDGADYTHRYTGHRNNATVKGVNFYGAKSEYIISGSDCGHVFLWDKDSEKIVQFFEADDGGVINVLEPHPNGPIIATSGLDHDIKIWAPTLKEVTDLKGLKEVMKKNRKERRDERVNEPDMIDGQMLWFLMHHLRRSARRRARRDGEEVSTSSEESERDEESEDSDAPEPMQCVHS